MDVVITEWALQSYLDLKARAVFDRQEYKTRIRPDAELLRDDFPNNQKFKQSNFWGPATDNAKQPIANGYKMKWHNIGPGKVQLRCTVAILKGTAYLCHAYVKSSEAQDKRECAKLKARMNLISQGRFQSRGKL